MNARLLTVIALLAAAVAASAANGRFRSDRILVQPVPNADPQQMVNLHAAARTAVLEEYAALGNLQVIQLPIGADPLAVIRQFQASGLFSIAEPDYAVFMAATPNDPYYANGSLWHLHNTGQNGGLADADIDGPEAWDTTRFASNIVVAIVDTGVRYTHEDLAANMWVNPGEIANNGVDDDKNGIIDDVHGINAAADNGNPVDPSGHGTQVAGIAGAVGNNGVGVAGITWRSKLMACRWMADDGTGSLSDVLQCIDYARNKGAQVINASFVTTSYSSTFYTAVDNCRAAGIIFVAAAGNSSVDNDATPHYPASFNLDNVVAVAATTPTDSIADYSNYGATSVDLGAPGSSIYSTANHADDGYVLGSGTSFSAPVVAGAFALMKARYPGETYIQLINRVLAATDPVSSLQGKCVTGGRLNIYTALGPSALADFTASPQAGTAPLTVNFSDTSYGTITNWSWNFGDGATSTAQHPSHTYNAEGNYNVTLTVTSSSGVTSSKSRTVYAVANYQISTATYAWVDPSSMGTLSLANDGVSAAQPLPFQFQFYGSTYNQIYVGANGLVGFSDAGLSLAANSDSPNAATPNNFIAPFWDDLNPANGGTIHLGTVGSSPNRRVVISWVNVPHAGTPPASYTFQVILEEGTQRIGFQYQSVQASSRNAGAAGKSATIGLEHATGLVAAKYSYNGSTFLADNQTILFTPTSASRMSVSPATTFASTGNLGGPFSPSSQAYTITNTGAGSLNWRISKSQSWLSLSATNGTLAAGQSTNITAAVNANANTLPAGSYNDSLVFENADNGIGNTTRSATLTVNGTAGILSITPGSGFASSGPQGGPFAPETTVYTVANVGDASISWSAAKNQDWLSLSKTNGSLAAGESTTISVSINANATLLATGTYNALVTFTNVTSGLGDTNRPVSLTVNATAGVLAVSPNDDLNSSGLAGGPFTPGSMTYVLTNTGGSSLNWSASKSASWLSLSASSGTLGPGGNAAVTVSINAGANTLAAGNYNDTVQFQNMTSANGSTTRLVTLTVMSPSGLVVSPAEGLESSGYTGGPFVPQSKYYTLSNASGSTLSWTARKTASWLSLSGSSGTLQAGGTATVQVSINNSANSLGVGSYSDMVGFTNTTTGLGNTTREVSLKISSSAGYLEVGPLSAFVSSGMQGGPFSPTTQTLVLSNSGRSSLNWVITNGQTWASISVSNGTLAAGASTTVTALVTTAAGSLLPGSYADTVHVVNVTSGNGSTNISAQLQIWRYPQLRVISQAPYTIQILGEPGNTYIVESGTNFASWTPVLTNAASGEGTFIYRPETLSGGLRMFRAVRP